MSVIAEDLLLYLTRCTIPSLYSHLVYDQTSGWLNICGPNYDNDPRISAPRVMVHDRPLTIEPILELIKAGCLDGDLSSVLSVNQSGFAEATQIRLSRQSQSIS